MALSDAGPALVFGLRTAAYEVLTSFAATYDHGLAARHCATLLLAALALALPFLWLAISQPRPRPPRSACPPALPSPAGSFRRTMDRSLPRFPSALLAVLPPLGPARRGRPGPGRLVVGRFSRSAAARLSTPSSTPPPPRWWRPLLGSRPPWPPAAADPRARSCWRGPWVFLALPPAATALGVLQLGRAVPLRSLDPAPARGGPSSA